MGGSQSTPAATNATSLFGGVPKGINAHLDDMSEVQQRRVLLHVNKLADSCFRECCTDFGFTKNLGSGEKDCLNSCVEKYVALNAAAGGSFADFLAEEPSSSGKVPR